MCSYQGIGVRLPVTLQIGPFGILGASEPPTSQYVATNAACGFSDPLRQAGLLWAVQVNDTMVGWIDSPPRLVVRLIVFIGG